jgi:hypothetical protein
MKRKSLIVFILFSVYLAGAQSIPDSELIARIKANKTKFGEWDRGVSLREKAASLGKDISANPVVLESPILCDRCPSPDPSNHPEVKRATAEADLVVVGHVVRNISALTQNEAFIFTDSEFVIDEIWKGENFTSSQSPKIGDEITIATPGGSVVSNGHRITAYPSNRTPLQAGHNYLMYLKYMPDSRSYIPVSLDGFDMTQPTVVYLRKTLPAPARELLNDKIAFLNAMRASTEEAMEENSK